MGETAQDLAAQARSRMKAGGQMSRAAVWELADELTAALAREAGLRDALEWINSTVEENCTPTGAPARIKDAIGNWHSGPSADVVQKVLRGLQSVARAALAVKP